MQACWRHSGRGLELERGHEFLSWRHTGVPVCSACQYVRAWTCVCSPGGGGVCERGVRASAAWLSIPCALPIVCTGFACMCQAQTACCQKVCCVARAHPLCKGSPAGGVRGSSAFGSEDCLLSGEARGAGALRWRPRARARQAQDAPCTRPCARLEAPAPLSEPPSLPQSAPPGRRRLPPARGSVHRAAPLPRSQEDELKEDAWARPARPRVRPARAPAGTMGRSGHRCCCSPPARAGLEPLPRQPPAPGPRVTLAAPGCVARGPGAT